ncbi:hypothetical protein BsWGS_01014 [Bradybaena similaris]
MTSPGQAERDLLSCSICLSLLQSPKTLPCMHRFCEGCLNRHIMTSTERTSGFIQGFSCPECRTLISAPNIYYPPFTWAAEFKTDFKIRSLIELYESRQEMDVPKVNNPCPKHEGKERELHCFDCSETACHLCAVISHRGCSKIDTLKEAAQERRAALHEHTQEISGLVTAAQWLEKLHESHTRKANKMKTFVEKQIRESAEKWRQIVTREEEKLMKELHKSYEDLQQNYLKFTKHVSEVKQHETDLSSWLSASTDYDLMLENYISDDIDLYKKQNAVINRDFRHFCWAVSTLKCSFQPHNIPCVSLGNISCVCGSPNKANSNFPMPSSWQP